MRALAQTAPTPTGVLLLMAALLLFAGQLALMLRTAALRRGAGRTALTGGLTLLGLVFLIALLDGAYRMEYLPYARGYPALVTALYGLPWLCAALAEAVWALLLGLGAAEARRFARRRPTEQSVKEAVDLLPAGVCIGERGGTVLLSNLQMNRWNRLLTGAGLSDANALRAAVRERGRAQDGKWLVRLEDGTALLFEERALDLDGAEYLQLTAEDVTEQFRVTRELEEKNARLRALQYRMKAYRVRETELLMREELLSARAAVHKQLGGALLTGKYHLEHPERSDPEALRAMLRQINTYLLAEVDDPEPRSDALESALTLAKGIGVSVHFTGPLPAGGALRALLGEAVGECAANTAKHAGGDRLDAELWDCGFRITNSGAPPAGEITPTGGLHSLRLAAERAGGRMELRSRPRFVLTVTLPEQDEGPAASS